MSQIIIVSENFLHLRCNQTITTRYGLFANQKEAHRALRKNGWKPFAHKGSDHYTKDDLRADVREANFDLKPADQLP